MLPTPICSRLPWRAYRTWSFKGIYKSLYCEPPILLLLHYSHSRPPRTNTHIPRVAFPPDVTHASRDDILWRGLFLRDVREYLERIFIPKLYHLFSFANYTLPSFRFLWAFYLQRRTFYWSWCFLKDLNVGEAKLLLHTLLLLALLYSKNHGHNCWGGRNLGKERREQGNNLDTCTKRREQIMACQRYHDHIKVETTALPPRR